MLDLGRITMSDIGFFEKFSLPSSIVLAPEDLNLHVMDFLTAQDYFHFSLYRSPRRESVSAAGSHLHIKRCLIKLFLVPSRPKL